MSSWGPKALIDLGPTSARWLIGQLKVKRDNSKSNWEFMWEPSDFPFKKE